MVDCELAVQRKWWISQNKTSSYRSYFGHYKHIGDLKGRERSVTSDSQCLTAQRSGRKVVLRMVLDDHGQTNAAIEVGAAIDFGAVDKICSRIAALHRCHRVMERALRRCAIPGIDPWKMHRDRMMLLAAFYFVSFLGK